MKLKFYLYLNRKKKDVFMKILKIWGFWIERLFLIENLKIEISQTKSSCCKIDIQDKAKFICDFPFNWLL